MPVFADEVARLAGQRRVFMRFAASANPGVAWLGDVDRRYGKIGDEKGEVPVSGVVETMGTGTTFLVNTFYRFETPTIRTLLADPDREWAQLAGMRGQGLTGRWLEYYLRHETPTGEIIDELVNRGQIVRPTFNNGRVALDVKLSPGKFLGALAPRRTVDQKDWPYALPDNYGKTVPFILGSCRNYVPPASGVTISPSGVVTPEAFLNQDINTLINEDFERFTGPSFLPEEFSYGNLMPTYGQVGYDNAHVGIASKAGIGVNGSRGVQGESWDTEVWVRAGEQGREGAFGFKYYSQINTDGGYGVDHDGLYTYLFELRHTWAGSGSHWLVSVYRSGDTIEVFFNSEGAGGVAAPGTAYENLDGTYFGGGWTSALAVNIFARENRWYDLQFRWRTSSIAGESTGTFLGAERNRDGIFEVMVDGVVVISLTGAVFGNPFAGYDSPTPANYDDFIITPAGRLGYWNYCVAGAVGDDGNHSSGKQSVIDHMWMKNVFEWKRDLTTATPAASCGSSGVGATGQGGGAVRCLLVDTGNRADGCTADMAKVSGLTAAYVAPVTPAAVTGLAGVVQAGGAGHTGIGQYYRVTAIKNGVESASSTTVGPFNLSGGNRRVRLTWDPHPDADRIRVYGSQQGPQFGQLHRYRYRTGGAGLIDDMPGNSVLLVDDNAGITTQERLKPDPHWDTMFRAQYYYYVSAKVRTSTGVCETPMAGPIMVQKTAPSTTFPVDVAWSAYTPPVAGQVLEGYVLRRQSQGYHWEINWTAQWEFDASTLSYRDDPVSYRSAVALPSKPTQTVKYLVSGHVPKAVPQVYVLKPVEIASTSVGDTTTTTTLTEPQQVLQVEGVDYTRETVEVNGRRYHLLSFLTPQRGDNCQEYEVTANVDGVETNADGSGELLEDATDVFLWVLLNLIFNTYDSSVEPEDGVVSPNIPSGGKYFNDVPYSPGIINKESFAATKTKLQNWLSPSGYIAARVLDSQQFSEELLSEFVQSFGLDFYWAGGQWHLDVLRPDTIDVDTLPVLTADDDVFKDSFTWWFDENYANVLPYNIGPLGGLDGGFLYTGEVYDEDSISKNGRTPPAETVSLLWTRDRATGQHVMNRLKAQVAWPALRGTFRLGLKGLLFPPSTPFLLTHPYGPGPEGFVAHVFRVTRSNPNYDDLKHSLEIQSIESEVRGT